MNRTRMLVVMLLFLGGCGSCQRSGEESAGGSGAAAPKATTAQAPAKINVAPLPPTIAAREAAPPQPGTGTTAPLGTPEAERNEISDCLVVIDANPDYGPPPLAVAFSAEAECSSGEPTIKWNFGDGSEGSTEMNPAHTYNKTGDYTASAVITSPTGATASDEIDITVEEGDAAPQ